MSKTGLRMAAAAVGIALAVSAQAQRGGTMGGGANSGGLPGSSDTGFGGNAGPRTMTPPGGVMSDPTSGDGKRLSAAAVSIDTMVTGFEKAMMNVAKAMPADKYSFAPTVANFAPGSPAKYDGVMAFGPMLIHVAQGIYGSFQQATGLSPAVNPKSLTNLKTKEEIVAALQESFDYAHKAAMTLTNENAFQQVRGQSRITIAATGIAHADDHYGQLVEYLRMNGVIPPGSAGAMPMQ